MFSFQQSWPALQEQFERPRADHRLRQRAGAHAALGHLQDPETSQAALAELLQRQPEFSCRLARKRLFYVKDPAHLDIYIEGLRKAGVPE